LSKPHQSCVDKTYYHDRGCGRTLDDNGNKYTGKDGYQPVFGHEFKDCLHLVTGSLLEAFTKEFYSKEEKTQAADNLEKDHNGIHIIGTVPIFCLVGKVEPNRLDENRLFAMVLQSHNGLNFQQCCCMVQP